MVVILVLILTLALSNKNSEVPLCVDRAQPKGKVPILTEEVLKNELVRKNSKDFQRIRHTL